MPTVDLVIPARDEAANVPALLAAVETLRGGGRSADPPGPSLLRAAEPAYRVRQVVLVDNASADDTARLAREGGLVVVHEPRRGYGSACLAGLRWIAEQPEPPDAVAFLDADLADDPAKLPELCDALHRGADLAIAMRVRLAEPGALDSHQRFGNWLACVLMAWATGRRYRDLGPMRVIAWEPLQQLDMRDTTWGWTVEMQFKAVTRGLRVVEIDAPYRPRRAAHSKISGSLVGSARAGAKIIATIARLWWTEKSTT